MTYKEFINKLNTTVDLTGFKLVDDFFNKVLKELDAKYFPDVKYYRDNDKDADLHYTTECFSNGVTAYNTFISKAAKCCNDTKENVHDIVYKYIMPF